jgi:hypothetical protein
MEEGWSWRVAAAAAAGRRLQTSDEREGGGYSLGRKRLIDGLD